MELLTMLAFATFAIVIAFTVWSKMRTDRKLEKEDAPKSSLARTAPDPALTPDRDVTDPNGVNPADSARPDR